jgi:hypothetical protein
VGVLKVKDPVSGVWLDIAGGAGAQGIQGVTGPTGPIGVTGPTGPEADEVWIGTAPPDASILATTDLWFDPDATVVFGTVPFPPGGTVEQALVKATAADGDVVWGGPHLKLTGGTVSGNVVVTGTADVDGVLTVPTVTGNVNFTNDVSANVVEDRTAYTWEPWTPSLAANWTLAKGGVWRNRYSVVISLALYSNQTGIVENTWRDVITPGSLPAGWRPQFDLWDSRMSVRDNGWSGSLFEIRVTNTGSIQVRMLGATLDWETDTQVPVTFSFPRSV